MNIKNRPVLQVSAKDQIIINLKREVELLRMENRYLREQLARISGENWETTSEKSHFSYSSEKSHFSSVSQALTNQDSYYKKLPPLGLA
jgi:hypothetical protein